MSNVSSCWHILTNKGIQRDSCMSSLVNGLAGQLILVLSTLKQHGMNSQKSVLTHTQTYIHVIFIHNHTVLKYITSYVNLYINSLTLWVSPAGIIKLPFRSPNDP